MLTVLKSTLIAFFLFLVVANTLVACKDEPKDTPATATAPAPEPVSEYVVTLHYNVVEYIADKPTPFVRVLDDKGVEYREFGSSSCDAYCQFTQFYRSAYNGNGVLSYTIGDRGERSIYTACYSCTHLDPSK